MTDDTKQPDTASEITTMNYYHLTDLDHFLRFLTITLIGSFVGFTTQMIQSIELIARVKLKIWEEQRRFAIGASFIRGKVYPIFSRYSVYS